MNYEQNNSSVAIVTALALVILLLIGGGIVSLFMVRASTAQQMQAQAELARVQAETQAAALMEMNRETPTQPSASVVVFVDADGQLKYEDEATDIDALIESLQEIEGTPLIIKLDVDDACASSTVKDLMRKLEPVGKVELLLESEE